jgi:hypothetical protein
LKREITNHVNNCKKKNFIPCIRLNGTSDISWENMGILQEFPTVQFYDYTKVFKRMEMYCNGQLPSNYHLTYSLNEDNKELAFEVLKMKGNISAVFRKYLPTEYKGYQVVNGDESDLRFLDKKNCIVGLIAKGDAKKDSSGFVLDV